MNCKDILNNKDFNQLIQYLDNCKSIATLTKVVKDNEEYSNFIIANTQYLPSDRSIYYRLMLLYHKIYNFDNIPRCKYCNKILEDKDLLKYFNGKSVFCSKKCYNEYPRSEETKQKISESGKKTWSTISKEDKECRYKKVEQTNLSKYGTKCTLNTKENIKKKKETWNKKYGVDNPLKSDKIKEKISKTNITKYGSKCPLNNLEIKEKAKQTLYKHYGVYHVMDSDIIKDKIRKNNLEKYGVDWNTKRNDVWIKACISIDANTYKRPNYKKYHIYKYPSGKEIIVQGYEDIALDYYILNNYNEEDIENRITFMNSLDITYSINGEIHRYIPDFYIKSKNLLIEVKSEFTFYLDLEKNFLKIEAAKNAGYDIITIVIKHIDRRNLNIKYKIYNYEDIKIEKEKYCK